jgi:thioredoxin-related protein
MRYRPLLIGLSLAALALPASAAELLMYRRAGCPWCLAWDKEIGPIYPKTEIGQRAPLRMVDLDQGASAPVVLAGPVRYTPTFVLAQDGREIGRIAGYPGESFFWSILEKLEARLDP